MDTVFKGIMALIIAYLLGSIPFALAVSYLRGHVDIRRIGTGNIGTMNVARELGLSAGIIVFILDAGKGCLAIFIAKWLGTPILWVLATGIIAIAGHNWSIFLKFRGGRGVATALGILLAITPLEFLITFAVMLAIFILTRNSGLVTGIGLIMLPFIIWAFRKEALLIFYPLAVGIFMGLRSLLTFKPNHVKMKFDAKSIIRIYPAFWRKKE